MTKTYTTSADLATEVRNRIDPRPEHFTSAADYTNMLDTIETQVAIEWKPVAFVAEGEDLAETVVAMILAGYGLDV